MQFNLPVTHEAISIWKLLYLRSAGRERPCLPMAKTAYEEGSIWSAFLKSEPYWTVCVPTRGLRAAARGRLAN